MDVTRPHRSQAAPAARRPGLGRLGASALLALVVAAMGSVATAAPATASRLEMAAAPATLSAVAAAIPAAGVPGAVRAAASTGAIGGRAFGVSEPADARRPYIPRFPKIMFAGAEPTATATSGPAA